MLFGRFLGTVDWMCPNCGRMNQHTNTPFNWFKVKCTACRAQYAIGLILYRVRAHSFRPSTDTLIEGEKWQRGQTVNRVVCASCSQLVAEHERPVDSNAATRSDLPMLLPRKRRTARTTADEIPEADQTSEGPEE